MFFEENLPDVCPIYVHRDSRARITAILGNVKDRMAKLEEALNLSGISGEQFAAAAKILFDSPTPTGTPMLDTMSATEIADYTKSIGPKIKVTPRFEWKNAEVVVDTAFVTIKEWEAIRVLGIGGSDAAVTMGISPYRTEYELYHDKVLTPVKLPETDTGKEFIFAYGHKVESLVIEEFCRRTGARQIPETRMFRKKGMPYITANVDAYVEMPNGDLFLFEAKTTTYFNKDAWQDNKIPVQYVPQCRQYLSVMDDPRIAGEYIGCIYGNTPNDFRCGYVKRDTKKEVEQLEVEKEFWEDYVIAGEAPELSGDTEKDIKSIRKFSGPAVKEEKIDLQKDDAHILNEYLALGDERKALEKKIAGIKERQAQLSIDIITEMGTAVKGKLPITDDTYYEVSYAPRSRTSIDTERLKLTYPDIYDEVVVVNAESSRPFSVKIKKEKNR